MPQARVDIETPQHRIIVSKGIKNTTFIPIFI